MKYLSFANSCKPFVINGKKQQLRRARRSGETTARQQIKVAKLHRRMLKLAA